MATKKKATSKTKPVGRPSKFTKEVQDEILDRIADGESVNQIGRDPKMPDASNIRRYIARDSEFRTKYEKAKMDMAEMMADEMLEIADDGRNDFILREVRGEEVEVPNTEHIQRSRLRIDTRKWLMSKLMPKKYGDKIEVGGNEQRPLKIVIGGSADG